MNPRLCPAGSEFVDWNKCPPEVYSTIFRSLGPKDLMACLFVNRLWRTVLERDLGINWRSAAESFLSDGGVDMKRNSKLNWQGVFFKSGVWMYGMDQLKVAFVHQYKSLEDYRSSMVLYKDKLHVSTRRHSECIDIESFSSTPMEEHFKDIFLHEESDHIRLFSDGKYSVRLVGKKSVTSTCCSDDDDILDIESTSPLVFLLEDDRCYIFEENKYLKVFTWEDRSWQSRWVARYYGSTELNTMTMHRNQLFLLGRHGDLWNVCLEERRFKKVASFKTPSFCHQANSKALLKTILPDSDTGSYFQKKDLSSIFVKGVTCAVHHAGVLFLAYSSGQIEAWVLKKNIQNPPKERFRWFDKFYLNLFEQGALFETYCSALTRSYEAPHAKKFKWHQFCEHRYDVVKLYDCIYNMAVYEGESTCYLLVNCGQSIRQYELSFPGFV